LPTLRNQQFVCKTKKDRHGRLQSRPDQPSKFISHLSKGNQGLSVTVLTLYVPEGKKMRETVPSWS